MILKALHDYMTDTTPLTGRPAVAFRTPQLVGGIEVEDRNQARRLFRDRIGANIYQGRRPRETSALTSCTIRVVAEQDTGEAEITGGCQWANALVETNIWTAGPDAANRANVTGTLLRLATEYFHWGKWGEYDISMVSVERRATFSEPPDDGSVWIHRYSMDILITYGQPAAVI